MWLEVLVVRVGKHLRFRWCVYIVTDLAKNSLVAELLRSAARVRRKRQDEHGGGGGDGWEAEAKEEEHEADVCKDAHNDGKVEEKQGMTKKGGH